MIDRTRYASSKEIESETKKFMQGNSWKYSSNLRFSQMGLDEYHVADMVFYLEEKLNLNFDEMEILDSMWAHLTPNDLVRYIRKN